MPSIRTLTGDISPAEAGHVQCHEHLLVHPTPASATNPDLCFDDPEKSLAELRQYRKSGGNTLVDAQPVGAGREAEGLLRLAEASGVAIVASTGFHKRMYYPEGHWAFRLNSADLARIFTGELLKGLYADDGGHLPKRPIAARAGIIKMALDEKGPAGYEAVTAAALEAAAATGAPVLLHTDPGTSPLAFLSKARAMGVAPGKIAVCHMDRSHPDLEDHRAVARFGAFLEYDTVARTKYHDDERELDIIATMVEAGFADRLLLSLDTTRSRLASYGGSPGLSYLLTGFLPLLKSRFSDETVALITRQNPSDFLQNNWPEQP